MPIQPNGGSSDDSGRRFSVEGVIRDPRYWLSLLVLVGVIVVALVKDGEGNGASGATVVPTATVTVAPTPDATATAAAVLDQKRSDDLETIAGILEGYRAARGTYPATKDEFQTVCDMSFDSGCQLLEVSKDLPTNDGMYPYWWRSTGKVYTLFTRVETPLANNGCTVTTPPALAGLNLMCRNGGTR
jgi:hypothetical protein